MWSKLDLWKLLKLYPRQKCSHIWTPKCTTTTKDDSKQEEEFELKSGHDRPLSSSLINKAFNGNYESNRDETSKVRWWGKIHQEHDGPWPPWRNASHSIFEMLGLGLFVAFGFRTRCEGERDRYHRCNFIKRWFCTVPVAQDKNIFLNVLPTVPANDTEKTVFNEDDCGPSCPLPFNDDESDFLPNVNDWTTHTEELQNDFAALLDAHKVNATTVEPSLDALRNQIESLAAQYAARIQNANAVQLAQENKMEDALSQFQEASNLGSKQAKYNLGICYESGLGVAQNMEKAASMYREAAALGHAAAAYNLGVLHIEKKIANHNNQEAVMWMEKASQRGVREAQRYMGLHHMNNKQFEKAVSLFIVASKQDDAEATYFLALCYEGGIGVEENMVKAAQMYHKAAELGNSEALYSLATYREYGLGGLPVDEAEARKMYKQAADQGHVLAVKRVQDLNSRQHRETSHDRRNGEKFIGAVLHESRSSPQLAHNFGDSTQSRLGVTKSSTTPYINITLLEDFVSHFKKNSNFHLENEEHANNIYLSPISSCNTLQP